MELVMARETGRFARSTAARAVHDAGRHDARDV
jgi:hypothetical protein